MGFLRKVGRKIKKSIKKVFKGIKKVVNKVSKSKLFKTIALVGAALVTGGASVGAFGGTLAKSKIGQALIGAKNFITSLPVVGTVAKPFEFLGTTLGTGAGKVTDFLGFTSEAGRLGTAKYTPEQAKTMLSNLTSDDLARMKEYQPELYLDLTKSAGTEAVVAQATSSNLLGRIGTGIQTGLQFASDVGSVYQQFQDPVQQGYAPGQAVEGTSVLDPLQVSFAQPAVNLNDAYSNLQFGTGDVGYLASDLYRQETLGGIA